MVVNDKFAFSAEAELCFVATTSLEKGIQRLPHGKSFRYRYEDKAVRDPSILARIRVLAIPPAWTAVRICPSANGHLQAIGTDLAGRRQYIYHPAWKKKRSEKKYSRLLHFGKALPKLRQRVSADLKKKNWSVEKLIAAAIRLLDNSHMRIGDTQYERDHETYGLTTLERKHARITGKEMLFCYRGKKGVSQQHRITDRSLINLIKQCRELPGKKLFEFEEDGQRRVIHSTDVNAYIHEAMGDRFSAKDFRTWAGTLYAFSFLQKPLPDDSSPARQLKEMLCYVSSQLGNTASVCRNYYIHPLIIQQFEKGGYDTRPSAAQSVPLFGKRGLSEMEKSLLRLLRKKRDTD